MIISFRVRSASGTGPAEGINACVGTTKGVIGSARGLVEIQSQGIFTLLRYASQAAPKVADSDVSSAGAYRREPR
jgi:hypothetical protein